MKATAKNEGSRALFQQLPSVDELLRSAAVRALVARDGHAAVAEAARQALAALREQITSGTLEAHTVATAIQGLADATAHKLREQFAPSLRPVINATGVILHTNLGRAPLAQDAIYRIAVNAGVYSNLEYDLQSGQRGKRDVHVQKLFTRLLADITGDPAVAGQYATVVVNNCAAAVLLALNTLAEGGEVIVSRGELVEIGGSFRVPDVMAKSNAVLREAGTTNRTHLADYERAINQRTRLLLRVHRSNFAIVGFTEQPGLAELAQLARKHNLPLLEDLGSGALVDLRAFGINQEPTLAESLRARVDVVTYSGDKLLGGPQAGLITGKKELIARVRGNPLFRALRVDKLTYSALESTLSAYLRQNHDSLPALRMMRLTAEEIGRRAEALAGTLTVSLPSRLRSEVVDGESLLGGGTAPTATLPTRLLALSDERLSADELAAALRKQSLPIIARVEEGRVLLDLRTVFPEQDGAIAAALEGLR